MVAELGTKCMQSRARRQPHLCCCKEHQQFVTLGLYTICKAQVTNAHRTEQIARLASSCEAWLCMTTPLRGCGRKQVQHAYKAGHAVALSNAIHSFREPIMVLDTAQPQHWRLQAVNQAWVAATGICRWASASSHLVWGK